MTIIVFIVWISIQALGLVWSNPEFGREFLVTAMCLLPFWSVAWPLSLLYNDTFPLPHPFLASFRLFSIRLIVWVWWCLWWWLLTGLPWYFLPLPPPDNHFLAPPTARHQLHARLLFMSWISECSYCLYSAQATWDDSYSIPDLHF